MRSLCALCGKNCTQRTQRLHAKNAKKIRPAHNPMNQYMQGVTGLSKSNLVVRKPMPRPK